MQPGQERLLLRCLASPRFQGLVSLTMPAQQDERVWRLLTALPALKELKLQIISKYLMGRLCHSDRVKEDMICKTFAKLTRLEFDGINFTDEMLLAGLRGQLRSLVWSGERLTTILDALKEGVVLTRLELVNYVPQEQQEVLIEVLSLVERVKVTHGLAGVPQVRHSLKP